jgi:hypothetical protein
MSFGRTTAKVQRSCDFVLGSIPNTVGSHIIGGTSSKATTTQFSAINGQPAAVTSPKANAR